MAEYIEREATLSVLRNLGSRDYRREKGTIADAMKMIMHSAYTPAADVAEVKHGKWKPCFEDWRKQIEGDECSVCGFQHYGTSIRTYHYCPSCGARMDGEGE